MSLYTIKTWLQSNLQVQPLLISGRLPLATAYPKHQNFLSQSLKVRTSSKQTPPVSDGNHFFFNDFPLFLTSCKQQLDAFSDLATVKGHKYLRKIFTPVVHTVNRKTWCRALVWSIKTGKISKNRNKQTSDQEHEKKLHSSRKKRNKSCLCFDTSLIQSFNIKFKVRSLKRVVFFFCFAYENLFLALMSRKDAELSTATNELIITLSESVQNKVELSRMLNIPRTTITSVLSKYRRTGTVETLMRSGRKRSFTNRDRNALKRLVKSNRWLTLQDITAKLNECKTNTFSQKTVQRVLHSEGYKRGLAKKKMVVREANQKKQV